MQKPWSNVLVPFNFALGGISCIVNVIIAPILKVYRIEAQYVHHGLKVFAGLEFLLWTPYKARIDRLSPNIGRIPFALRA
jgi:hypothetical protein